MIVWLFLDKYGYMEPAAIEKNYVQDVYNIIAGPFDITRAYIWNKINMFIKNIPPNSLVADIGCGNGKNMTVDLNIFGM